MTESQIQAQIVKTLRKITGLTVFSVPNEAAGNQPRRQAQFVRTGLLPGVSDLIVIYHGKCTFLEVKTPRGKQSDRQKKFQARVEKEGYDYRIVRSVEDALDALRIGE